MNTHASPHAATACLPSPPQDMNGALTVFIVGTSCEARTALSRLLMTENYRVCEFESAENYLEDLDYETPGCLLLDDYLPGLGGIDLQHRLIESPDARPVVFLTGSYDIEMSVRAMKAGAVDLLTKPVDENRLCAAISEALVRDTLQRSTRAIDNSIRRRFDSLTRQERKVMTHIIRGRLNKQIAGDFGISTKTVKVHRERVRSKMRASSVPDLVRLGARIGIAIEPVFNTASETLEWRQPADIGLSANRGQPNTRAFAVRHSYQVLPSRTAAAAKR